MRLHCIVRGRVQGVGFRHFVKRRARGLGLTGWVRNCPDGTVELVGEGEEPALRTLLEIVTRGPASAEVSTVDSAWSEGEGAFRAFEVTS